MSGRSGFGLIPGPARILAALNFVVFFFLTFDHHRAIGLGTLIGLAGGTLAGAYFLLAGYVYADAVRRAMPPNSDAARCGPARTRSPQPR